MKTSGPWCMWFRACALCLMMGVATSGCASISWKEEVLLHDGRRIIVERSQSYGGRHAIGQSSPVREHTITFTLPDSGKTVSWTSEYDKDLGRTNFNLLALHIRNNTPYLVVAPNLCMSYNKWGRPNPPYIIFGHHDRKWQRIPLSELPVQFETINLIVNKGREEDIKALERKSGLISGFVSAEDVKMLNNSLTQPYYKTILRQPLSHDRINHICEERVLYKGSWIRPDDQIARQRIDRQKK